jgi:hypothetical protein
VARREQIAKEGFAMNDIQALEHELIGLAKERETAVRRRNAAKAGFIDDVIANRKWWLQRLKAEQSAKAKED